MPAAPTAAGDGGLSTHVSHTTRLHAKRPILVQLRVIHGPFEGECRLQSGGGAQCGIFTGIGPDAESNPATLRIKYGIIPKNSGIYPNPAAESKVGYIPLSGTQLWLRLAARVHASGAYGALYSPLSHSQKRLQTFS